MFWILTVGFVIYAAYLFLSAGEDEDKVKTAKSMVKYALIAAAVALLSTGIDTIVSNFLQGK